VLLAAVACGEKSAPATDEHVLSFDTATVRLASRRDTLRLSLELARDSAQRTMGLMERQKLAENAGMLFVYDSTQGADAAFWMYRTRIPLDIAFLDSAGVIRTILAMAPCTATLIQGCPSYPPGATYRYALEMNAGFFARKGIVAGDRLVVGDVPSPRNR
jgi:uncharacterized membrane protein (UPF0127 family)